MGAEVWQLVWFFVFAFLRMVEGPACFWLLRKLVWLAAVARENGCEFLGFYTFFLAVAHLKSDWWVRWW